MTRIYFSCADSDVDFIDKLRQRLNKEFAAPVCAERISGAVDADRVARALKDVSHVIFIRSEEAFRSYQCYLELRHAVDAKLDVFSLYRDKSILKFKHTDDSFAEHWPPLDDDNHTWLERVRQLGKSIQGWQYIRFTEYGANPNEANFSMGVGRLMRAIRSVNEQYDAFISYSRRNTSLMETLRDRLLEAEYEVWTDTIIRSGTLWWEEIKRGIEGAHTTVLLLSNAWFASSSCVEEYEYASNYNKRIVPIFIESYDETAINAILKERPWKRSDPSSTIQTISDIYTELSSETQPITHLLGEPEAETIPPADQDVIFDQLANHAHMQQNEHVHKHTELLVRAIASVDDASWLLTRSEWRDARQWLKISEQESRDPAPTDDHRDYIRRSLRQLLMVAAIWTTTGIAVLSVVVAVIFIAQTLIELTRTQAAEDISREAQYRLQTLSHNNQILRIPTMAGPLQPVLAGDSVWISYFDAGRTLRLPLNGQPEETLPTGANPGIPISDGQYVWISDHDGNTVTRFSLNALNSAPVTIPVADHPGQPLVTDDGIWVLSQSDPIMTRIDPITDDTQALVLTSGYQDPFVYQNTIWLLHPGEGHIRRIYGTGPDDDRGFQLSLEEPVQAIPAAGYIWVTGTQNLLRLDPQTETIAFLETPRLEMLQASTDETLVWAVSRDENTILGIDAANMQILQRHRINGIHKLYVNNGLLWILTSSELIVYDPTRLEVLNQIAIQNARELTAPVDDGLHLWFTLQRQGEVFAVNKQTGDLYRNLQPCQTLTSPAYDGINLWFACPDDNELLRMPSSHTFFSQTYIGEIGSNHHAVWHSGYLWLLQPGTGRLIVYDPQTTQEAHVYELPGAALPLHDDGQYLWTAVRDTGDVYRFDPANFSNEEPDLAVRSMTLGYRINTIQTFRPALDTVWITSLESNMESPLAVLDRSSLEAEFVDLQRFISGLTYYDGAIWISTFTLDEGFLLELDPSTFASEEHEIPDSPFGGQVPLPLPKEQKLWFSTLVASLRDTSVMIMSDTSSGEYPFNARTFDPVTKAWGTPYPMPGPASPPVRHGDYMWYPLLNVVPSFDPDNNEPASSIFGLNFRTGNNIEAIDICDNIASIYVTEHFAWAGCYSGGTTLAMLDGALPVPVRLLPDVGIRPEQPVEQAGYVWIAFQQSDHIAVFDACDGELLRLYATGRRPVGPVAVGDDIWLYNVQDDSVQRLTTYGLPPSSCVG